MVNYCEMFNSEANRNNCYKLNSIIEEFVWNFITIYFADEDGQFEGEFWFIEDEMSDELNYNLYINDEYYDLATIYTALRYNISKKDLSEWYDKKLSAGLKGKIFPNLKNWYKLKNR